MNEGEYGKMYQLEDHYWWFVGRRNLALSLLKPALGQTRSQVIDLGCGTGVVLRELQSWSSPIGFDMSALALSFCRKRGLSRVVQGDGVQLPFAAESVDAVFGLDSFEHIEDDAAAFREAFRVIKQGGTLVMSVPAFKFLWGPHDIALMHFRRYRRDQVRHRLEEAGFHVERVSYSVFFLFPIIVLWRILERLKKGPAQASLVVLPTWINRSLIAIQSLETSLLLKMNLPYGSSVIAVGRKPAQNLNSNT
jgi:SAM-dependent methyltransferase